MKNFKTLFIMMAVAMMASCTNDVNDVLTLQQAEGMPFIATLAPKTFSATTRTLLNENADGSISSEWQVDDEITLRYGDLFSPTFATAKVTEVKADGSATIEASLGNDITDGQEVSLGYSTNSELEQDGQLSNKLDWRAGTGIFKVIDGVASLDGSVAMEAIGSIFKFTLQDLGGNALNVKKFSISSAFELAIINLASAASSFYVGIVECSLAKDTEIWLTATDEADNPYIAKVTTTKQVDPGKFYQTDLKMATLGDLMNSDGSFSATAEEGKTPIGVIAYLGNDNFTEPGVDGGGHGLVLALKNAASKVKWSTNTTDWQFDEDAKVQDVAALKRTTNVSGYSYTKGLATRTDAQTNYTAAYAAWNYTATVPEGTTGWFLPSAQQWVKLMTGLGGLSESAITWGSWFDNNHTAADKWEAALKKAGEGNYDSMTPWLLYWSSSEYSQGYAVGVGIDPTGTGDSYGFAVDCTKKDYVSGLSRVRSVLAF